MLWAWRSGVTANSAFEAELTGILMVVQLGIFRNHRRVIIEGDNKTIMDALGNKCECPIWTCTPLFDRILLLSHKFISCIFRWVPRSQNVGAHLICQWARRDNGEGFCKFGDVPPLVRNSFLANAGFNVSCRWGCSV